MAEDKRNMSLTKVGYDLMSKTLAGQSLDITKIVMGDADGVLSVCPISPGEMKEALKNSVKRDFTQSEWNLYIGKNIPYTTFSDKL